MPFTVIADADALDQALVLGFFEGFPALESPAFASIRTVDQVEVDVAQSAFLKRRCNAALGRLVPVVGLELGAVKDVGSVQRAVRGREKACDGCSDALLVVVPFRTVVIKHPKQQGSARDLWKLFSKGEGSVPVKVAVARLERPSNSARCFVVRHFVDAQSESWNQIAICKLGFGAEMKRPYTVLGRHLAFRWVFRVIWS